VLRTPAQVTQVDIAHLRTGNNDLIDLAHTWANLDPVQFVLAVMLDLSSESAPNDAPSPTPRIASDCTVPFGTLSEDCFNKKDRIRMQKENRTAAQLGLEPLPNRRQGSLAYLKVTPDRYWVNCEFVDSQQRYLSSDAIIPRPHITFPMALTHALNNYDNRDSAICTLYNTALLVWLARGRFYSWYHEQAAVPWDQHVLHPLVPNEPIFQPMEPLRVARNIFSYELANKDHAAAGTAINPNNSAPNGTDPHGNAYPVVMAQSPDPPGTRQGEMGGFGGG
jgi:hypothetical protein